ncbi:UDP-glucose 4-epimerase GalE [Rhodococcus koreensis]|uniref:UDP-glucose 4-epimerase GalE n=1 Tax=Rhodococcus koreensis TaxID=99653 RepID=UPI0036DE1CC7
MRILVTGGAGYIGAHVVRALDRDGHRVLALDDLSTGIPERLARNIPLYVGSVHNTELLVRVMRTNSVQGVIHLAGKKAVEESVARPLLYYRENLVGILSLLTAMAGAGVKRIVYSSSAAVYGTPSDGVVTEDSPTVPESPYGWTKLMGERMIRDTAASSELSWASLRYFNVAGTGAPCLADRGENNLIPRVFRAVVDGTRPQIFGGSHSTPDGTCIRDYVHVDDLADAHVAVVERMEDTRLTVTYNVGTGTGTSVLQMMQAIRRASGFDFRWDITAPRPGDPPRVVASAERILTELGWHGRHDLDSIVQTAWQGWCTHPSSAGSSQQAHSA